MNLLLNSLFLCFIIYIAHETWNEQQRMNKERTGAAWRISILIWKPRSLAKKIANISLAKFTKRVHKPKRNPSSSNKGDHSHNKLFKYVPLFFFYNFQTSYYFFSQTKKIYKLAIQADKHCFVVGRRKSMVWILKASWTILTILKLMLVLILIKEETINQQHRDETNRSRLQLYISFVSSNLYLTLPWKDI